MAIAKKISEAQLKRLRKAMERFSRRNTRHGADIVDRMEKAHEAESKLYFLRQAMAAGFSRGQAKFLYENFAFKDHFRNERIGE